MLTSFYRRTREFYNMTSEKTYKILQAIAQINGLEENLHKVKPSEKDLEEEETAEENRILATNRHHFKNIEFTSSLTGHTYRSSTNEKGTLSIFDVTVLMSICNLKDKMKSTYSVKYSIIELRFFALVHFYIFLIESRVCYYAN